MKVIAPGIVFSSNDQSFPFAGVRTFGRGGRLTKWLSAAVSSVTVSCLAGVAFVDADEECCWCGVRYCGSALAVCAEGMPSAFIGRVRIAVDVVIHDRRW